MIQKLQIRFIAVAMLSLLFVLLVIMVAVNGLNYRNIISQADETLLLLAENEGRFPFPDESMAFAPEKKRREPPEMSPEMPYETRYFSVVLNDSGEAVSVDTGRIAAVDTGTAVEYAQDIWQTGTEQGFLYAYRYFVQNSSSGVRVIFLDCGRSLQTFRNFLLSSLAVSVAGLIAVFLLLILLSARIVKPVSESYEKQKRFITNAGHEIKTPLTIIDADAEILEMDCGENEWIRDIRAQTKRLASLTNDLIFLSRMEEGTSHLQMLNLPFSDIVAETANSFQALAKTQQKTFRTNIAPMLTVCGDEKSLRQLVSILLDNAVKYTEINGKIDLALEKQGHQLRLSVTNTSGPMRREDLGRIFDRFYRLDESRNSQTGGYGIGLSIAQAIVNAHRGKITASSSDGYSLTITAVFPLSK